MAGQHGIFQSFAKMKRLLPRQKDAAGDQDLPKRLPREPFPTGIKTLYSPDDGTIDIVFVHGLTGNRDITWTARDMTDPWPKSLLPFTLTTSRILTFGYDAYVADWRGVVSQTRIANHAWNLLTSLASYRENDRTNERPIIFVCHSLGGLVCEDALVTSRQRSERHLQSILHSTRGIIFLGTPHHGAGLAKWAELISRSIGLVKQTNSNIIKVLRRDSEVLARIQQSFHTMVMARSREGLPRIEISCFYEELPLLGVGLVVPQDSAILPGYIPIGIHSNHTDMTKFTSTDDPGFVAVCGELRRWIRDIEAVETHHENLPLPNNRDLDEQAGTASQHGDGNRQFNNFGTGTQKNVDGNYFEAKGDQHFGMIPSKESIGRKET
ncbi:sesB-related regulatory [Staphylotrichum tortipilum]|uniref:SesB-related regulatory n=1 Tax=Staphylotrichum tortipilum TaxID=2831512 RepID=A0AAN6MAH1_9PEZI|nr:sesB-related regulatory [Staphylotrichum longicolle]